MGFLTFEVFAEFWNLVLFAFCVMTPLFEAPPAARSFSMRGHLVLLALPGSTLASALHCSND